MRRVRAANCPGASSAVSSPAGVATTTIGSPAARRRAMTARSAAAAPQPRLLLGELEDRCAEELEVERPAVGVDHRADEDDHGPGIAFPELGNDQRAGRAGESGDAQADLSLGERLCQGCERLPLS